jgi:hypothetical protein
MFAILKWGSEIKIGERNVLCPDHAPLAAQRHAAIDDLDG